jgi:hypothetical protein
MIINGDFKVVDLTLLIFLIGHISSQCLLYYQELENKLAKFQNYKENNHN